MSSFRYLISNQLYLLPVYIICILIFYNIKLNKKNYFGLLRYYSKCIDYIFFLTINFACIKIYYNFYIIIIYNIYIIYINIIYFYNKIKIVCFFIQFKMWIFILYNIQNLILSVNCTNYKWNRNVGIFIDIYVKNIFKNQNVLCHLIL